MKIDKQKYKESLARLWHTVFGDEYGFIELVFKSEYDDCVLCFAELENERAVSAFYLIENTLKFEGRTFRGYYLYAAATLPECRGRGLMSSLIKQALEYCRQSGCDYVSLVPSEESLYSYYSRFGFLTAMYRCEALSKGDGASFLSLPELTAEAALEMRNGFEGNIISFSESAFSYAADCLYYYGHRFYALNGSSYLLCSAEGDFAELFSAKADPDEGLKGPCGRYNKLTAPFFVKGCEECRCVPYGMLFPVNAALERTWKPTDIYMNIALD